MVRQQYKRRRVEDVPPSPEEAEVLGERVKRHLLYGEWDVAIALLKKAKANLAVQVEWDGKDIFATPLGYIVGFEDKMLNILEGVGIKTIGQLLDSSPEFLLQINGFGECYVLRCQTLCRKFLTEKKIPHGINNLC